MCLDGKYTMFNLRSFPTVEESNSVEEIDSSGSIRR
jgi:hypothetical protein